MNKAKNEEKVQVSNHETHLKKTQEKLKELHGELALFIDELIQLKGIHKPVNQLNSTDHFTQEKMDQLLEQMDAINKKIKSNVLSYEDLKKDRDIIHRDFKVIEEGAITAFKLCRLRRVEVPESLEKKLEEYHKKNADLKHL